MQKCETCMHFLPSQYRCLEWFVYVNPSTEACRRYRGEYGELYVEPEQTECVKPVVTEDVVLKVAREIAQGARGIDVARMMDVNPVFIARQINKAMARGLLVKKSYGKYEAGPKLRGLEGETESKAGA